MVSADDAGRLFLQAMISRRVISEKLARALWKRCVDVVNAAHSDLEYQPQNNFHDVIAKLNRSVEPLDLKLSISADEVMGKAIVALVNTKSDELVQLATEYIPTEIAYFKVLVEQIILSSSNSYSVSSMTALREVSNVKGSLTKTQAEIVLDSFVTNGWLLRSRRGRFSLSTRSLLELQAYLKNNYDDYVHECTVCYEYVTKGVGCYVRNCSARLHRHCYVGYARSAEGNVCTSCKQDWSDKSKLLTIGEDALKEGEDSTNIRRQRDDIDDEDSAEDSEEAADTEIEEEPPVGTVAGNSKGKRKQRVFDDEAKEDDSDEMEVDDTPPQRHRRRR